MAMGKKGKQLERLAAAAILLSFPLLAPSAIVRHKVSVTVGGYPLYWAMLGRADPKDLLATLYP